MHNIILKKGLAIAIIFLFLTSLLIPITTSNTLKQHFNSTLNDGSLSGYITDKFKNPIKGVLVRVNDHGTYKEDYTDSSGYYNITNITICYCKKNCTALKKGYKTEWASLSIAENTTYNFILKSGNTLYVGGSGPGNYTNIQAAIDNSSKGDTVYVYNGTYNENIIIDITINLFGEDTNSTIIDGGGSYDVIYISADFVNVSGFKIINSTDSPKAGIHLSSVNNCTISKSNVSANNNGIRLDFSSYNIIKQNIFFSNNDRSTYIVWDSNHNTVIKNKAIKSGDIFIHESSNYNVIDDNFLSNGSVTGGGGIVIHTSEHNIVINNTIINAVRAIRLSHTYNNIVAKNTVKHCKLGVTPVSDELFYYNIIYHNNFINNTQHANDSYDNTWYNETLQEGNFWDNYNGTDEDGDGIGDIPYDIPGGLNQDLYPLMYPWYPTHPEIVYVDNNYNISTPGFGYNRFNRIQYGINEVPENGTVYVYNGTYFENLVINKTINLFGEDTNSTIIDGNFKGNGISIYAYVDSVNISRFSIINSDEGIILNECNKCHISNCLISSNSRDGIDLHKSSNNTISDCILLLNQLYYGIRLRGGSSDNNILNCIFDNNKGSGILLWYNSDRNEIKNCIFSNHSTNGIRILNEGGSSDDNFIFHNNFFNNSKNARDECSNTWDNDYPSGGNYWDDYTGNDSDGDGIGDTPYPIPGGDNYDYYPLMNIWGENPPVANFTYIIDGTTVQFNSSLSYDRDGEIISYEWTFGDGNNKSGEFVTHTYSNIGKYNVTLTLTDNDGHKGNITKIIEITTQPPEAPIIYGETNGKAKKEYEYTFISTDPDNDPIMYFIDWGDNNTESTEYGDSGVEIKLKHTWNKKGEYTIKAKAKDIHGVESDWGILKISMPKNKNLIFNFPFLSWLFELLSKSFPILRYLLG